MQGSHILQKVKFVPGLTFHLEHAGLTELLIRNAATRCFPDVGFGDEPGVQWEWKQGSVNQEPSTKPADG